jgi:hypothetical protein
MTTTNEQMELGFNGRIQIKQEERATRSAWWFARMRKVVDNAFDWKPIPQARPEQIEIPGTHRQIQICE